MGFLTPVCSMFWKCLFLLHMFVFFCHSMQIFDSALLYYLHLSTCLDNVHFGKCTVSCLSLKHVLFLPFFFCWYGYILRSCFSFVHRHAGSGRPTSAPWRPLAWQHSRSSTTASIHTLHALMSSGTIHLWWYVTVQTSCCNFLPLSKIIVFKKNLWSSYYPHPDGCSLSVNSHIIFTVCVLCCAELVSCISCKSFYCRHVNDTRPGWSCDRSQCHISLPTVL